MKQIVLAAAVAAMLAWALPGTGFCQDDEEGQGRRPRREEGERGERPEGRKRWKEMRNREDGGEEGRMREVQGRDQMGGEPGERTEKVRQFMKQRREGRNLDPETRERMKEINEVEKQSRELAKQYRGAETDEEKQTIAADLKAVLVKGFDLKVLNQQKNMERLEKRLEELKDLLKKRKESRGDVIQSRLDELTGKTEHLKW